MVHDRSWNVQPHRKLTEPAENLWTVEGTIKMPPGPLPHRTTIARLQSGALVIFSAIALNDAKMQKIEVLGRPSVLIVPNTFHGQDAAAWKARYPDMRSLRQSVRGYPIRHDFPLYLRSSGSSPKAVQGFLNIRTDG